LTPGSERGKISRSAIRDEQPRSYFQELLKQFFGLKIPKFFDVDPGGIWDRKNSDLVWEKSRIRDPGINIPDLQHC
jgi:hypothetical protein